MKKPNTGRAVCWLLVIPMALTAQVTRDRNTIPLKHWEAPLYWQPPRAEARAGAAEPEAATTPQAQSQPLQLVAITPCRVLDTRAGGGFGGLFGPPSLTGVIASPRVVPIPSANCGVPASAAYSLNFTLDTRCCGPVVFLAAWPDNIPFPGVSLLNALSGGVVANAAVVPAGPDGGINVQTSSPADLIIDINGYYVPAGLGGGGSNATSVNGLPVPAAATLVGTNNASQFTPVSATQATAFLNPFTSSLQGLVPSSGGGTADFLRADGSWVAPPSPQGTLTLQRISVVLSTAVPAPAGAVSLPLPSSQGNPTVQAIGGPFPKILDAYIAGVYGGALSVSGLDGLRVEIGAGNVVNVVARAVGQVNIQIDVHVLVFQ